MSVKPNSQGAAPSSGHLDDLLSQAGQASGYTKHLRRSMAWTGPGPEPEGYTHHTYPGFASAVEKAMEHVPAEHILTKSAAVSTTQAWLPIDQDTPRGVKLQLISRPAGVATYGTLTAKVSHFTHWAPLPSWTTA